MHFKEIDYPLQFEDLWQVAGVRKSLAQNWTNGRPFRIRPSISAGEGKGSRSIYALGDAYFLCLLHKLKERGLAANLLAEIADRVSLRIEGQPPPAIKLFSVGNNWFCIGMTKHCISWGPIAYNPEKDPVHFSAPPLLLNDVHDVVGIQVAVNLVKLRAEVDERLRKRLENKRRGYDNA
jgi:hypothetical protein